MANNFSTAFAILWIKWRSSLVLALRSLWLHKLRSMLSVLGIIIGTASVIVLMALGKGSMEDALDDIRRQGTTNIIVKSIKPTGEAQGQSRSWVVSYGLTEDDRKRCALLDTVIGHVPMRIFPQEVRYVDKSFQARLVGTTEDYAKINHFEMAAGRFLVDGEDQADEGDAQRLRNVVVLGAGVAERLFPFEDIIGKSVVIKAEQYRVVGVIKSRTPRGTAKGGSQEDFNQDVYIPIRTCQARFGARVVIRQGGSRTGEQCELHQITLTVSDIDKVRSTGEVVRAMLERYHANKNDWEVLVPLDRLEEAERTRDRYVLFLAFIASISLGVGGIGIMNIMLATVTERTREIGIRRALGAKRRDITMQFIIEAMVQTTLGGILGTLTGFAMVLAAFTIGYFIPTAHVAAKLEAWPVFLSVGVAMVVGVLFGWYPAWRASRLDPIEALRHN